jgi:hypothetical protein
MMLFSSSSILKGFNKQIVVVQDGLTTPQGRQSLEIPVR